MKTRSQLASDYLRQTNDTLEFACRRADANGSAPGICVYCGEVDDRVFDAKFRDGECKSCRRPGVHSIVEVMKMRSD